MSRLDNLRRPILCYVTDRRSLPLATSADAISLLLRKIETVAAAGMDWVQIREKDLCGRDCAALTSNALSRVAGKPASTVAARVLVNDRLDVALSTSAGGAHLGEESLPVHEARRLVSAHGAGRRLLKSFLLGVSCHSLEAACLAERSGADYIFFGPIFDTPSKAAYGAPQGLQGLEEITSAIAIPVIAIGGITVVNAESCFSAGAAGIAAIRLFQDAADPAAVIDTLRKFGN